MLDYYMSGSYSPRARSPCSPCSPRSVRSPNSPSNEKLHLILSKCENMHLTVSATRKKIKKISSANSQKMKILEKMIESKATDYSYKKLRITQKQVKSANLSPVTDVQKKIVSLIEPVLKNEKFSLERSPCQKISADFEKKMIDIQEMNDPEAKELLKVNKRNFGQAFHLEVKESDRNLLYSPRGKPPIPVIKRKNFIRNQRDEFLCNYLEERCNLDNKILIQKMIHQNMRKL